MNNRNYQNKKPIGIRMGYHGVLLVERGSILKDEQTLMNKQIKFITNIVCDTLLVFPGNCK